MFLIPLMLTFNTRFPGNLSSPEYAKGKRTTLLLPPHPSILGPFHKQKKGLPDYHTDPLQDSGPQSEIPILLSGKQTLEHLHTYSAQPL
jgi:hypothetical protein